MLTIRRIAAPAIWITLLTLAPACHRAHADGLERRTVELNTGWSFKRRSAGEWMPAAVPGCVHTDLLRNGAIPDPFQGTHEKDVQWVEREDWDYRTTFVADRDLLSHDRIELVFDGLDTFAQVLLNGKPLLSADNMFRTWRVETREGLRAGTNTLEVRFDSPIRRATPAYQALGYRLPAINDQAQEKVSPFTRKAPYHYGWDWGPRLVTSGIWRPVRLEAWNHARIASVQVQQLSLDEHAARLRITTDITAMRALPARLQVLVNGAPASEVALDVREGGERVPLDVTIPEPRRWWPAGAGAQPLYSIEAVLTRGDEQLDRRATRVGLRTVEVEHARDAGGKSFTVKVNGVPMFMKGANWVPLDSFPSRITPARYRAAVADAVAANMNMLRVWGGGIYEDDAFYQACDEMGVLLWQDFMFACSMYPGDAAFLDNVRREAVDNVRRLRNHPSIALWSGNNEIEVAWPNWGWKQSFTPEQADAIWRGYTELFHRILPAVVREEDGSRFYTRSSPSANDDALPANKLGSGDMHYWEVWHAGAPYTAYRDNVSRFMSEYGFQSFPEERTLETFAPPDQWRLDSPVMLAHQKNARGNQIIDEYMRREFKTPKDFRAFLYVAQVQQAEIIQFAAESHRRAMPHNMGSLYWQLGDVWPVASWSGIDYFGRWKALHWHARRFFAPVMVSAMLNGDTVSVVGVSDRLAPTPARLRLRVMDFGGRVQWSRDREIELPANTATKLDDIPLKTLLSGRDRRRTFLAAELLSGDQRLSESHLFFQPTKEQLLKRVRVTTQVQAVAVGPGAAGSGGVSGAPAAGAGAAPDTAAPAHSMSSVFRVTLTAPSLAREIRVGVAGLDGKPSDNYFDLLPGEPRTIELRLSAPATTEAVTKALQITTLADAF